jgi:hypothetical protein
MKKSMIRAALAAALPAALSGCYVLPVGSDGVDRLVRLMEQQNGGPTAAPAPAPAQRGTQPKTAALPTRLYPINDIATGNGMLSGTVTNLMDGKARFQLAYKGENLIGEATRVSGEDRKGVATAWAPSGTFMTCEYQMSSLVRGAGTCDFSDGARYQVHVGN